MLKLYKLDCEPKLYWETWDNDDGSHTVHWGTLGTTGKDEIVKKSLFKKPQEIIQKEVDTQVSNGFQPIEPEHIVLIEYAVEGFGTEADLDKRHRLEERMNHTLGWAGLGHCDGGSIGSGTMEVCNMVVDTELAISVIKNDLKGTEWENYTRVFVE